MTSKAISFANIGSFGVAVAQDGDDLLIRIPLKGDGVKSQSGKMTLKASTGGWTNVPGTDLRLNVMAGCKA
jgi:hypothetical protein